MIRSKGEAGTGNVVEAVRHLRSIMGDIRKIGQADNAELFDWAKQLQAPLPLVQEIAETGELPVPMFCAGGIATPADASLVMQLGAQAVFVGSGIFKSDEPAKMASAIVEAATHYPPVEARTGSDQFQHGYHLAGVEIFPLRVDRTTGAPRWSSGRVVRGRRCEGGGRRSPTVRPGSTQCGTGVLAARRASRVGSRLRPLAIDL